MFELPVQFSRSDLSFPIASFILKNPLVLKYPTRISKNCVLLFKIVLNLLYKSRSGSFVKNVKSLCTIYPPQSFVNSKISSTPHSSTSHIFATVSIETNSSLLSLVIIFPLICAFLCNSEFFIFLSIINFHKRL